MRVGVAGPIASGDLARLFPGVPLPTSDAPGSTSVAQLVHGLLARGHELLILSLSHSVNSPLAVHGEGVTLKLCPLRRRHRGRDAYRVERRHLAAALEGEKVDLIHAQWTYEYALAALGSAIPTIVTVRDWAPTILRRQPDPYRAMRLVMSGTTLGQIRRGKGPSRLTTVSPYIQARLRRLGFSNVEVIPNGLGEHLFRQHQRTRNEHPRLVSINHGFTRWKNVGTLLRAFSLLAAQHPSWRLRLVGRNFEPNGPAHRWARERGLEDRVEFLGSLSHERSLDVLQTADLLVHPSLEESFGNVLLEAMALRVPTIAGARSGAVPWILDNGSAGVLTDVTSANRLAADIEEVLANERRWHELSQRGWERAWQEFRLDHVLDRYVAAYDAFLASMPGS